MAGFMQTSATSIIHYFCRAYQKFVKNFPKNVIRSNEFTFDVNLVNVRTFADFVIFS